jgi:transcriptional regulator with XRE-family HTH domain
MTPFGLKVRELRAARGVALKEMAAELHISSAYLSALEHGKRGRPSPQLIRQICGYFGIIWDEAEELERLADLSHPKVTLDTSDLSPKAVELANRLANCIHELDETVIERLLAGLGDQGGERGVEAKRRAGRR